MEAETRLSYTVPPGFLEELPVAARSWRLLLFWVALWRASRAFALPDVVKLFESTGERKAVLGIY